MRTTFVVTFNSTLKRWECRVGGQIVRLSHPDDTANEFATTVKTYARALWLYHEVPTEVQIANKRTGRFTARGCTTYGKDPIKPKG